MTAEIAVMNKSAVALAADSAVTIGTHPHVKVYNGINKLFALSKHSPVGIMVYGQAEFMGVPWEPIIKLYRRHLGKQTFDTLKQYADNFITFIETNAGLFSESHQALFFRILVKSFYEHIVYHIDEEVQEAIVKKEFVTEGQVKTIVSKDIREQFEDWSSLPHLDTVPANHAATVIEQYPEVIKEIIEEVFQQLPLTNTALEQLRSLAGLLFAKDRLSADQSGVVIAGFGENEIFPSLVSYDLEGIVAGRLKYRRDRQRAIGHDCPSSIIPFAQSEVVGTFMEGIDPYCRRMLNSYLKTLLCEMYPKAVVKKIGSMKSVDKAELSKRISALGSQVLQQFSAMLSDYTGQHHIGPVVEAVEFLPKAELAAMAESLVNLTSFKRRVSLDAETVGGPIDVAVISKGDGFIWTRRKHYFTPEINPQFYANHYGNVRLET